jgi:peptidyl-tRNA hydrolase
MKPPILHTCVNVAILLTLHLVVSGLRAQTPPNDEATPSALQAAHWTTISTGRHLTVRVNPDADMSLYGSIAVGTVAYTGSAHSLQPKQASSLVVLLHDSLVKELSAANLSSNQKATRSLILNVNITRVKRSHPLVNAVTIAAVFVPLDLGKADVTAQVVDEKTGQIVAEIDAAGCGHIYQVLASLQPLGQSKIVLKKESRTLAREVTRIYNERQQAGL